MKIDVMEGGRKMLEESFQFRGRRGWIGIALSLRTALKPGHAQLVGDHLHGLGQIQRRVARITRNMHGSVA